MKEARERDVTTLSDLQAHSRFLFCVDPKSGVTGSKTRQRISLKCPTLNAHQRRFHFAAAHLGCGEHVRIDISVKLHSCVPVALRLLRETPSVSARLPLYAAVIEPDVRQFGSFQDGLEVLVDQAVHIDWPPNSVNEDQVHGFWPFFRINNRWPLEFPQLLQSRENPILQSISLLLPARFVSPYSH